MTPVLPLPGVREMSFQPPLTRRKVRRDLSFLPTVARTGFLQAPITFYYLLYIRLSLFLDCGLLSEESESHLTLKCL